MKQRRKKDTDFLENCDVMTEDAINWMKGLFLAEGTEKFRISEDVLDFGFDVIERNYRSAKSKEIRKLMLRKILHTREVVEAGIEIMEAEGGVNWDPYMAGAVTFLHDMGRFPQAHLGDYSDTRTGFDHGNASAEMILAADFPESIEMGMDMKRVAEAVREHSRLSYKGDDVYGRFVRDADKLALMDYFHHHIVEFPAPDGKVTAGAIKTFLKGRMVLKKDMLSRIDVYLCWLSWQCDFNFEATRELFVSGGMKEYMLGEIKRMDEEVWKKVVDLG